MYTEREICDICPSESELSEILTNINCTEHGCTSVFPNTSTLKMHLIKTHSKPSSFLSKKSSNRTSRYFCPIKTCKYQMNKDASEDQLRWFTQKKHLKQHYFQVHKEKIFKCLKCEKSFLVEKDLNSHIDICGEKFKCISCSAMYNNPVSLAAHCKRKKHINLSQQKNSKVLKTREKRNEVELKPPFKKECHILPKSFNNPIENIAAAALSELSWKIVVRGVDKEVQTVSKRKTPMRSMKKRDTQETQTGEKKTKISRETQTISSYKNVPGHKPGIQTQTFHDLFPELSQSSQNPLDDVILPQFFTSSTQTAADSLFDMKKDLDFFNYQPIPRSYNDQIDGLIERENSILGLKYCNIETQTEVDFTNAFIEPILSNTETQTIQNAIDEYSHNYTQTCDDGFLNGLVEFSDIETQTGWANFNDESGLVSTETQTAWINQC